MTPYPGPTPVNAPSGKSLRYVILGGFWLVKRPDWYEIPLPNKSSHVRVEVRCDMERRPIWVDTVEKHPSTAHSPLMVWTAPLRDLWHTEVACHQVVSPIASMTCCALSLPATRSSPGCQHR